MPAPHHPPLSSNQLPELQWQEGFNHKLYFALKMGRIGFAWFSWQHIAMIPWPPSAEASSSQAALSQPGEARA